MGSENTISLNEQEKVINNKVATHIKRSTKARTYKTGVVSPQIGLPGLSEIPEPTRVWPDLSAYGLHFGQARLPGGIHRLIMIDDEGAWESHAPQWGFEPSRWKGLWVRKDTKFSIPKFDVLFPDAIILQLTDREIEDRLKTHLVSRQSKRMSQDVNGAGVALRMSWHPSKRISDTNPVPLSISPLAAIGQTKYLGSNLNGDHVYESGDGSRFIKLNDQTIVNEDNANTDTASLYLRLDSNNKNSIIECASGLVQELQAGKILHASDFERYLEAVFGVNEVAINNGVAEKFSEAIDFALISALKKNKSDSPRINFFSSLKFHEGRPSYYRGEGNLPTPLPIASAMQTLACTLPNFENKIILDINSSIDKSSMHAWNLDSVEICDPNFLQSHDVTLAGVFSRSIPEENVDGLLTTREDHKTILNALKHRDDSGISVFLFVAGNTAGHLDGDFKRLLAKVGSEYEINAICDIDARMISPGNVKHSRLFVVGKKRKFKDYTFSIPTKVNVIYDYEALWDWTEKVCGHLLNAETATFGFDSIESRTENRWQAPYIPSSQVSEPLSMSPRNLLGPVRRALARVENETGLSTDDYVAKSLKWTNLELSKYLDSEQIDAVSLSINAIENNRGMIEADQTGLGKGRVIAAIMRYLKLKNPDQPLMFFTKTEDLFNDIYRDIIDIGSLELFRDPVILNSGVSIFDNAGIEIGRSFKKDELTDFLISEKCAGRLVLSTYSQFNRKLPYDSKLSWHRHAAEFISLIEQNIPRSELLQKIQNEAPYMLGDLRLDDHLLAPTKLNNDVSISLLESILSANLSDDELKNTPYVEFARQLEFRSISNKKLTDYIKKFLISNTELRLHWIKSDALKGAVIFADEAHIAAGPTSQTNINIREILGKAQSTIFSSATFAKNIDNYHVYEKAFPSSLTPTEAMLALSKGGAPMQEILSTMLAEDGRMIRREHDLSNIDFIFTVDNDRIERNHFWANSLANVLSAMAVVSGDIEDIVDSQNKEALEKLRDAAVLNGEIRSKVKLKSGLSYSNFTSGFYSLNRTFMLAVCADLTADCAISALSEGRKPVITVENTMESTLNHMLTKHFHSDNDSVNEADTVFGDDSEFELSESSSDIENKHGIDLGKKITFRDVLEKYIENIFYGFEWKTIVEDGVEKKIKKRANFKRPGMEIAEAEIREMISMVPDIPISPLDAIKDRIRAAGYSIEEISGRSIYLAENSDGTHSIKKFLNQSKKVIQDNFNSGRTDAIILSKSGSTGISLHASETFEDQSQRELIEAQAASDIVERLQFWGRVKRKGEVCQPIIRMVSAGLPGEIRLKTMQNAHLRKLSANISGNSDNSGIDENAPDILNSIGNEVCYRWLENNPADARFLGIKMDKVVEKVGFKADGSIILSGTKFVDLLTLRVLLFNVAKQADFNKTILTEFKSLIEQYELEGRNPLKAGSFDLRATRTKSVLFESVKGASDSIFNKPVMASEISFKSSHDGVDASEIEIEIENSNDLLINKFQSVNWIYPFISKIKEQGLALMPLMLASRYPTIDAALADSKENSIKHLNSKINFLCDHLPDLLPGSVFRVDFEDDIASKYLVIRLDFDKENYIHNPSSYRLKLLNLHTREFKWMSLSTILNAGKDLTSLCDVRDPKHRNYLGRVLKDCEKSYIVEENRVVLENNLFQAAKSVERHGIGRLITYTNEKGVWQQGFILPQRVALENIWDMPYDLNDPEIMAMLLSKSDIDVKVTNSLNIDFRRYQITNSGEEISIVAYGSTDSNKWLVENNEIQSLLLAPWDGHRKTMMATVNPKRLSEFCSAFIRIAEVSYVKPLVSGSYRELVNTFISEKQMEAGFDTQKNESLDDIDAQLASLKI